eukprot:c9543_g1_i1.p1 GENE.c9543_g1_i1~~c9543_g1_i1.p1  ORF type:complete len:351 (-),score=81.54 c9543_g1_i1:238-1290(-)
MLRIDQLCVLDPQLKQKDFNGPFVHQKPETKLKSCSNTATRPDQHHQNNLHQAHPKQKYDTSSTEIALVHAHNNKTMNHNQNTSLCVAVFVGEVAGSNPTLISIHPTNENLFSFSRRVEKNCGVSIRDQTIKVLASPDIQTYCMRSIPDTYARSIPVTPTFAILIERPNNNVNNNTNSTGSVVNNSSGDEDSVTDTNTVPKLRAGRFLKVNANALHRDAALKVQDEVRRQMTAVLNDRGKRITFDVLANITNFSKSSLSLYRRGTYKGNNTMVAKAVAQALAMLEHNDFQYLPSVHDGSCAVLKGQRLVAHTSVSSQQQHHSQTPTTPLPKSSQYPLFPAPTSFSPQLYN